MATKSGQTNVLISILVSIMRGNFIILCVRVRVMVFNATFKTQNRGRRISGNHSNLYTENESVNLICNISCRGRWWSVASKNCPTMFITSSCPVFI